MTTGSLKKFISIYRKLWPDEDLTEEDVLRKAEALLQLYRAVYGLPLETGPPEDE
ncbi:MAG: hypothetical protein AAB482_00560 [Patescibacteria group bacterium]